MKKRILAAILAAAVFLFSCIPVSSETNNAETNNIYEDAEFDTGSVIAVIKQPTGTYRLSSVEASLEELGISEVKSLEPSCPRSASSFSVCSTSELCKLTLANPGRENVLETVRRLNELSYVEDAEPNYIYKISASPNDIYYKNGYMYGLDKVGAQSLWDLDIDCSGVSVAVIDSGILKVHEDLADNLWKNPNETADGSDSDGNGYVDDINGWDFLNSDNDPTDDNGHGTHVSGTVSAVTNNSKGVASLARNAKIVPLKVVGSSGETTSDYILSAIRYVGMMNIPVVNISMCSPGYSTNMYKAIKACSDTVFACAAGNWTEDNPELNNDISPMYPASYNLENIISVAATDYNDNLASYSHYGLKSVDIASPGSSIYSTYYTGRTAYKVSSGTSMATPLVTSTAALMRAKYPDMTCAQIVNKLKASADPLNSLNGYIETGGRLNAYEALALHAESVALGKSAAEIEVGSSFSISAEVVPADTTDKPVWESDNESVASVKDGIVTGKGVGSANITVTYGNASAACEVSVYAGSYSVTLNTNGGSINGGDVSGYTYGEGVLLPTDVTKTGHTFDGWYESEEFEGEAVSKIGNEEFGDKVYYAKWTVNMYSITFSNYDGTLLERADVSYGEMPEYTGAEPQRADEGKYSYVFSGWSPELAAAHEDAEYTAQFLKVLGAFDMEYTKEGVIVSAPEPGTYYVIFVKYSDSSLSGIEIKSVTFDRAEEKTVAPEVFEASGADRARVMMWKSFDLMQSLCSCDIPDLGGEEAL